MAKKWQRIPAVIIIGSTLVGIVVGFHFLLGWGLAIVVGIVLFAAATFTMSGSEK